MTVRNTTLDDVAAVVGFTATLNLSSWFGDISNVYIPEQAEEGQVIARLIGLPAARRLSKEFGGDWLAIPKLSSYEVSTRKRMIARLYECKFEKREISSYLGMSVRRVEQIIEELALLGLVEKRTENMPVKNDGEKALEKAWVKNPGEKSAGKIPVKNPGEKSAAKSGVKNGRA